MLHQVLRRVGIACAAEHLEHAAEPAFEVVERGLFEVHACQRGRFAQTTNCDSRVVYRTVTPIT
jgi:hypothetical protein